MKTHWIKPHVSINKRQIQISIPVDYYEEMGGSFYVDKLTGRIWGEVIQLQGKEIIILKNHLESPYIRRRKNVGRPKKSRNRKGKQTMREFQGYNTQ